MIDEETALTQEQLRFFNAFGYLVLRQLLGADDLGHLARELRNGLAAQYPPERQDGSERLWTRLTDEGTPYGASLMEDPRFLSPAQQICGEDVLGIGVDVNSYIGPTNWHPDTPDETIVALKFIFYLDPLNANTGALRLIPCSHLLRGEQRQAFFDAVSETPLQEVPCQAVATEPGDVIAYDIRTWHASDGGSNNRRSWNLDYFRDPESPEDIERMCSLGLSQVNSITHHQPRRQYNYSRNWLDNPHKSPVRQRWIDRLNEIGYLDQPGVSEPENA